MARRILKPHLTSFKTPSIFLENFCLLKCEHFPAYFGSVLALNINAYFFLCSIKEFAFLLCLPPETAERGYEILQDF